MLAGKNKKMKIHPMFVAAVVLTLTLLSVYLSSGLYARFSASDGKGDSARTAAFSMSPGNEAKTDEILLAGILPDDVVHKYTFTVTPDSETAMNCYVKVETTANLPLEYKIKYGDDTFEISDTDFTKLCSYASGETGTKSFELSVVWPKEKNEQKYSGEIELIRIVMKAEQID